MSRRRNVVAPQLLRQIVSIVVYLLLFASALKILFDYDVKTALTGGAVLAAVIGLALQDTLGNLFSGIALHMEGAFDVGDVLHSGDYVGVVESVSWRATRIRGFNNQIIVLPNSVIARERLEVFPHTRLNARVLPVSVDYNIPPATVIGILSQAAAHVDGVARELPCFARVASFADSAVIYEIKYHTRDYAKRDRMDADIRKAVWYALHRNKIAFATPIRAYQQYTPPEVASHRFGGRCPFAPWRGRRPLAAFRGGARDDRRGHARPLLLKRGDDSSPRCCRRFHVRRPLRHHFGASGG